MYAVCRAFQKQPNNTYLNDGILIFITTVILSSLCTSNHFPKDLSSVKSKIYLAKRFCPSFLKLSAWKKTYSHVINYLTRN